MLLLKELLKNTSDSHPDYVHIEKALTEVEKIASYINSKKKEYESQEAVAMIQARMMPKVQFAAAIIISQHRNVNSWLHIVSDTPKRRTKLHSRRCLVH